MEEQLIQRLLAAAGVTALVSQRIWPGRRSQGSTLPAIVAHRIDGGREYHLKGDSGLSAARMQIDCWGDSYASAKRVARAVVASMSGARWTAGGVRFDGVLIEDESDDTFDEGGQALFRTRLDLMVHHAIG